jgi:hypothetical protein
LKGQRLSKYTRAFPGIPSQPPPPLTTPATLFSLCFHPLSLYFSISLSFSISPPPAARTQLLFARASHATASFFRSIDWAQLQAGQTPSPIKLDDISDFSPKSTSKSKAQVRPLLRHWVEIWWWLHAVL